MTAFASACLLAIVLANSVTASIAAPVAPADSGSTLPVDAVRAVDRGIHQISRLYGALDRDLSTAPLGESGGSTAFAEVLRQMQTTVVTTRGAAGVMKSAYETAGSGGGVDHAGEVLRLLQAIDATIGRCLAGDDAVCRPLLPELGASRDGLERLAGLGFPTRVSIAGAKREQQQICEREAADSPGSTRREAACVLSSSGSHAGIEDNEYRCECQPVGTGAFSTGL
jgi:hypothetical protein